MSTAITPNLQHVQATLLKASGLAAVLGYAEIARDYVVDDVKTSPSPWDFKVVTEMIVDLISDAQHQIDCLATSGEVA